MNTNPETVLYFDGVCNLCNSSVQFLISHDRKKELKFASLQSSAGVKALERLKIKNGKTINSVLLFQNGNYFTQSDAALRAFASLGGIWQISKLFLVVPRFVRDGIYHWISKNRYRWFGKRTECLTPTTEHRSRFIDY